MPATIQIAAFVLGGVLLLVAVVGGRFKIFGAEVSHVVGRTGRIVAGVLGVLLVGFGLLTSFPSDTGGDRGIPPEDPGTGGERPSVPWTTRAPYSGDCGTRPPGTVCAGFEDGYVWLVRGSVSGWEKRVEGGRTIQVAISGARRYEHVLGTHEVRILER